MACFKTMSTSMGSFPSIFWYKKRKITIAWQGFLYVGSFLCRDTNLIGISGKSPIHSTELMILPLKFSLSQIPLVFCFSFIWIFKVRPYYAAIKSRLDVIKLCLKTKQKMVAECRNFWGRFYCLYTVGQNRPTRLLCDLGKLQTIRAGFYKIKFLQYNLLLDFLVCFGLSSSRKTWSYISGTK